MKFQQLCVWRLMATIFNLTRLLINLCGPKSNSWNGEHLYRHLVHRMFHNCLGPNSQLLSVSSTSYSLFSSSKLMDLPSLHHNYLFLQTKCRINFTFGLPTLSCKILFILVLCDNTIKLDVPSSPPAQMLLPSITGVSVRLCAYLHCSMGMTLISTTCSWSAGLIPRKWTFWRMSILRSSKA